jgi:hypothetical protein
MKKSRNCFFNVSGSVRIPFDLAQDRPFDLAQDRPFDLAQDRPFDFAQDRLALKRPYKIVPSTSSGRTVVLKRLFIQFCGHFWSCQFRQACPEGTRRACPEGTRRACPEETRRAQGERWF